MRTSNNEKLKNGKGVGAEEGMKSSVSNSNVK